jgi:hypothetical protein
MPSNTQNTAQTSLSCTHSCKVVMPSYKVHTSKSIVTHLMILLFSNSIN